MNLSSIKTGLSAPFLAALLAGCSSNPAVEEQPTSTDIEDTSVQTGQVDTSEIEEAAVEAVTADTIFYFDFDKALLKPESCSSSRACGHAAEQSAQCSPEGHADERGTREYNMALGERRALAVKEFLVSGRITGTDRSDQLR